MRPAAIFFSILILYFVILGGNLRAPPKTLPNPTLGVISVSSELF